MHKTHVFQHSTTCVQIFVYHCISKTDARLEFFRLVKNHEEWIYLGQKTAQDA